MTSIKETTNIYDLPTDPIGGSSISNNITMNTNEVNIDGQNQNRQNSYNNQIPNNIENKQMTLDQSTINQIINGLQQASLSGSTSLPSRDIPMDTINIINDKQVQPNYIPQKEMRQEDYINNNENDDLIINNYNRREKLNNSLDNLYNELQIPLLISLLYFIFQLPFFRNILYNNLQFLFNSDGNYNLNGLIFISILFGIIVHLFIKFTNYI